MTIESKPIARTKETTAKDKAINSSRNRERRTEEAAVQKERTWLGLPIFRIESPDDLAKALARRESHFMFLVTSLVVLVTALTGFTVWDSAKRSEQSSERAENYVREITGAARPKQVTDFSGLSASNLGGVGLVATLTPEYIDTPVTPYFIEIKARFKGTVAGGPGKVVGIETKLEGRLLEIATSNPYGERIESRLHYLEEVGLYDSQGEGGIPVGFDGSFSVVFKVKSYFHDCYLAQAAFESIQDSESQSVIHIRPVFDRIDIPPDFKAFSVMLTEYDGLSCDDWEYLRNENNTSDVGEAATAHEVSKTEEKAAVPQ